jgi:hypothetical protein
LSNSEIVTVVSITDSAACFGYVNGERVNRVKKQRMKLAGLVSCLHAGSKREGEPLQADKIEI